MARKRKEFPEGCLASTWPLFIIFAPLVLVLKLVLENLGAIFGIVLMGCAIFAIVAIISARVRELEEKETDRQRNLSIVNAVEQKPALVSVPHNNSFHSKEEELINQQFCEFIRQNNAVIEARAHKDYLVEKEKALTALKRFDEANQIQQEIDHTSTLLNCAQTQCCVYESQKNGEYWHNAEIKTAYLCFAEKIPTVRIPFIGDFLHGPEIKTVPMGKFDALAFTPAYVMYYSDQSKHIKLIEYKDVSISTCLFTEILKGSIQENDEIEHIGYLHETKDGRRDMRYSYENNPSYTFVYRGSATIHCGDYSYEQNFCNKSQTEAFKKSLKAYLSIINKNR